MKLYVILGAILFGFVAGGALGYFISQHGIPALITDQQIADDKVCNQAQAVTKGANDVLQKDRDAIATQLDALRLQHPERCVRVSRPASVPGIGAKHANDDGSGVSSDWLRTYAAQCETYRSEVGVCVDFLAAERKIAQ